MPMDSDRVVAAALWAVGMGFIHIPTWLGMELAFRRWVLPATTLYEGHLFGAVIRSPYEFFVSRATGKVAANVTMCADRVRMVGERIYFGYLGYVVQIVGAVAVMVTANWQSAVIYVAGITLLVLVGRKLVHRVIEARAVEQDVRAAKSGVVIDAVTGFTAVKSFHTEWRETRMVKERLGDVVAAAQDALLKGMQFWHTLGALVRMVIWPALVGVNVWLLVGGQIGVGEAVTAITAGMIFTESVWGMIGVLVQFIALNAEMDEAHTDVVGERVVSPTPAPTSAPVRVGLSGVGLGWGRGWV